MVRAKLKLCLPRQKRRREDVLPIAVHTLQRTEVREEYEQKVSEFLLARPHNCEESTESNWEAFKECVVAAGEEVAGRGGVRSSQIGSWKQQIAYSRLLMQIMLL